MTAKLIAAALGVFLLVHPACLCAEPLNKENFSSLAELPLGQRIALWAESFVGTPYDPDPLGEYVTTKRIVADERVDCMYLTFRSVELAMAQSPQEALALALDLRFVTRGIANAGVVENYDQRYEYAMDMIAGGKWGTDITPSLKGAKTIEGARHHGQTSYIPKEAINNSLGELKSGDIVYFVKPVTSRKVGEIIGHIGIVKTQGDTPYLIHASGSKNKGGVVKKLPLIEYTDAMKFIGIKVTRFTGPVH